MSTLIFHVLQKSACMQSSATDYTRIIHDSTAVKRVGSVHIWIPTARKWWGWVGTPARTPAGSLPLKGHGVELFYWKR